MRLILAVTGASALELSREFIINLPENIELYTIFSDSSKVVDIKEKVGLDRFYLNSDISAPVASGSFQADAMAIIPTSANTLSKIACGIADNLITRTASVMIKEQKKLLLAPRELPLSPIMLENMLKLSRIGVIIAPPIIGYYSGVKSLKDAERFLVGKWYDILGIKNNLYRRWEGV
jgi:4-hydroxy-3-polyprenylbenzoate decarboxylase